MSVYLKIKIKSLAAEGRIIRHEERKRLGSARWVRDTAREDGHNNPVHAAQADYFMYRTLHRHRTVDVRREARAAQIAYGYLRYKAFDAVECGINMHEKPNWDIVLRLCTKYYSTVAGNDTIKASVADWLLESSSLNNEMLPSWAKRSTIIETSPED